MERGDNFFLFLDDIRIPLDCVSYMHSRIGKKNPIYLEKWTIVRNYEQFVKTITKKGIPNIVSFDHDLAEEHYIGGDLDIIDRAEFTEKTGYDCAKWLLEYCVEKNENFPEMIVHSMNRVGTENIESIIKNYKKHYDNRNN